MKVIIKYYDDRQVIEFYAKNIDEAITHTCRLLENEIESIDDIMLRKDNGELIICLYQAEWDDSHSFVQLKSINTAYYDRYVKLELEQRKQSRILGDKLRIVYASIHVADFTVPSSRIEHATLSNPESERMTKLEFAIQFNKKEIEDTGYLSYTGHDPNLRIMFYKLFRFEISEEMDYKQKILKALSSSRSEQITLQDFVHRFNRGEIKRYDCLALVDMEDSFRYHADLLV